MGLYAGFGALVFLEKLVLWLVFASWLNRRFSYWFISILLLTCLFNLCFKLMVVRLFLTSGGSFSRSSREPKYKIEFHTDDAPFHPVSALA